MPEIKDIVAEPFVLSPSEAIIPPGRVKSLVGQRFGKLVVESYAGLNVLKKAQWRCRCDCGGEKTADAHNLVHGRTTTCGCFLGPIRSRLGVVSGSVVGTANFERRPHGIIYWECLCVCGKLFLTRVDRLDNGLRRSCGCLSRSKVGGNNAAGQVYSIYRRNAKLRGFAWEVSVEMFLELTQKPCFYCGIPPSNCNRNQSKGPDFIYNGIDRIDSKLGYVAGNVTTCCGTCNWMKGDTTLDDFRRRIISIYNHWAAPSGI